MNSKKSKYFKTLRFLKKVKPSLNSVKVLTLALLLASSVSYATWQGTSWVITGETINSVKLKANMDYLYSLFKRTGNNLYYTEGNVGVGTSTPQAKLDISGPLRLGDDGATCTATTTGFIKYNSNLKRLEICNGSEWSVIVDTGNTGALNINSGWISADTVIYAQTPSNSAWETIDLSSIVGARATLLSLEVCSSGTDNPYVSFRPNGETSDWRQWNAMGNANTATPGNGMCNEVVVPTGDDGKLQLWGENNAAVTVTLRGYVGAQTGTGTGSAGSSTADLDWIILNNNLYSGVNGNVGIGTTAPQSKLDVAGGVKIGSDTATCTASKEGTIRYNSTNSSLEYCDGASWTDMSANSGDQDWVIDTNNIYTAVTGNVGIGTNTPLAKLHISTATNDKIRLDGTQTDPHTIFLGGNQGFRFWDDNNGELLRITETGNVGIGGVVSPSNTLQVQGSARIGAGSTADLIIKTGTPQVTVGGSTTASILSTSGDGSGAFHVGFEIPANDSNDGFYISTDSNLDGLPDTVALKVNAAGNLGLGTISPQAKLDVAGTVKINGNTLDYWFDNTSDTAAAVDTKYRITRNDGTGNFHIYINSDGGTSPTRQTNGYAYHEMYNPGSGVYQIQTATSGASGTGITWQEALAIRGDGNVGFGLSNPLYKLDVAGDINFTGDLYKNGSLYNPSLWTDSGTSTYLTQTGDNVGIGTTSPTEKLDVRGNIFTTGTDFRLWNSSRGGAGTSAGRALVHIGSGTKASSKLYINYGGDFPGGTIIPQGNVGIGTTSPAYKLDVNGTARISNGIIFNTSRSGHINLDGALYRYNGNPYLTVDDNFYIRDTNGDLSFRFITGDNPDIRMGTNTTSGWNSIWMYSAPATKTLRIHGMGNASNQLRFGRYGNNYGSWEANPVTFDMDAPGNTLVVAETGRVGLGLSNPSSKLEVAGNIEADAYCDRNGSNCSTASQIYNVVTGVTGDNLGNHIATKNLQMSGFWINGDAGNGGIKLSNSGQVRIDTESSLYDVWLQGGSATSGDNRNLALLGLDEDSGDYLYINYGGEYAGGVRFGSSLGVNVRPGVNTFNNGKSIALGDNDTGIRQDGDGQLELWTNNSERLHIDSSGRVGIATPSPSNKFTVTGVGDIDGANSGGGILLQDNTGASTGAKLRIDANEMQASDNGAANNFAINPFGGSVGVGDFPNTADTTALDVNGNLRISSGRTLIFGDQTGNNKQSIYGDDNATFYFDSSHDTASRITLRDDDNDVYGSLHGSQGDNIGLLDGDGQWAIQHNKDNYTRWLINNSEKMRLTSSGNLGVGIANPLAKLDLNGLLRLRRLNTTSEGGQLDLDLYNGNTGWHIDAYQNDLRIFNDATNNPNGAIRLQTNGAVRMIVKNGNIGIANTNPAYKLDVTGDINFTGDLYKNGSLYNPSLWTDSGTSTYLTQTGDNVGIGTTNPSEKLEVNGNVKATAFYYSSDRRLKKDIKTIQGLDLIKKLRGVEFSWKDSNEKSAGLIAQEVEKVAPYLVKTDKNTGLKSVLYANLVAPLIEAVKELYNEISDIKNTIADIIFTQKKHDEELRTLKKELEIQRQEIKELKLKLQNDAK